MGLDRLIMTHHLAGAAHRDTSGYSTENSRPVLIRFSVSAWARQASPGFAMDHFAAGRWDAASRLSDQTPVSLLRRRTAGA